MGLLELDAQQTKATNAKEKIANKVGEFYSRLKKKYGNEAVNDESNTYAAIAGYLIQARGNSTQEESIEYRRRLVEENIEDLKGLGLREKTLEADMKQKALDELAGTSNKEVLDKLKAINPAAYEQVVWWKDEMHQEYKQFLKDHSENFRDQANNYNLADYLSIHYKWGEQAILPSELELETKEYDEPTSLKLKQSANSIKRKDHTSLPRNKDTGDKANIDTNFGYNQYNALVDQVERAYTAPAWEAIGAFARSTEFEKIMGGKTNATFVKNILRNIKASRSRKAMLDDENQMIGGVVALTRKLGTQATLGGFTQPLKQVSDQLAKIISTTGRIDLVTKNFFQTAKAMPLLERMPIGRRGDAQAGAQYAAQFNELARKIAASVMDRKWTKAKEFMTKTGEVWMAALRMSDVWIAQVSWLTYYEIELRKRGIEMQDWTTEARLFDTDTARQEAAAQAEFMVDFYAGASDPTKMAQLSKQGNNGWREFSKMIFLPFNSFSLQQKSALMSDMRDLLYRGGDKKEALAGITGIISGMIAFHSMRIFLIGGLIYPVAMMALKGMFGIDMDEPDEDEQERKLRENWRKMKSSIWQDLVAGGAGQFFQDKAVDAFNRTKYLWDAQINPDEILNKNGEVMSFQQYEKELAPLYRFRSRSNPEYTFGIADVLTEQATKVTESSMQLMSKDEMDKYTRNEQAYAYFAASMEWMYFFRLMDTDLTRIARKMKYDMDKDVKEREKRFKKILND